MLLRLPALLLGLSLLLGPTPGWAGADCRPADPFSEKVGSVLRFVEGGDFPSESNLEKWSRRRGMIHAGFSDLLKLSDGHDERRRATVHALVAAEGLSMKGEEAELVGRGLGPGEIRAWARRVLKDYTASGMGAKPDDVRFLDEELISELDDAWANHDASEVARTSLPVYQEKATALRALASCE